MTGTATAPQNGHWPGAEFPMPASGERPPQHTAVFFGEENVAETRLTLALRP